MDENGRRKGKDAMRLTRRDDSGVTSLVIILLSILLLGAVGIAVDASRAVAVTRSAQNSADAVALAMAKDCVGPLRNLSPSGYDRFIRTGPAIGNGQTQSLVAGGCGAGFVTARATEPMDYTFAKVFGASNTTRSRPATARWGELAGGIIFPFTFSNCAFPDSFVQGNSATQGDTSSPGTLMMLYGQTTRTSCPRDASTTGQSSNSKGFVEGGCRMVSVGGTIHDANGNSFTGTNCDGANLDYFVGKDVLIPVWGSAVGGGGGVDYTVTTLVGFHVMGWSSNGSNRGGAMSGRCEASGPAGYSGFKGDPATVGDDTKPCLYGYVTSFTSTTGGTTGAPCFASPLSSACFVYLDS
jgi:hypothetical protein